MKKQKFGRKTENFYIKIYSSYVYTNLINSGMKPAFTKQLRSDIFRPTVAGTCVTRKLIIIVIYLFLFTTCNGENHFM